MLSFFQGHIASTSNASHRHRELKAALSSMRDMVLGVSAAFNTDFEDAMHSNGIVLAEVNLHMGTGTHDEKTKMVCTHPPE